MRLNFFNQNSSCCLVTSTSVSCLFVVLTIPNVQSNSERATFIHFAKTFHDEWDVITVFRTSVNWEVDRNWGAFFAIKCDKPSTTTTTAVVYTSCCCDWNQKLRRRGFLLETAILKIKRIWMWIILFLSKIRLTSIIQNFFP